MMARPARGRVSARLGVAALWLDAAGRLSYHPGGGARRVVARRVSRAVADASLRRVLVVDDRFRILDLATGHQLAELVEPPARIGLLVLSPDGGTALVRNGMGRLWWWQEGASWRRSVATPVLSPALSPDQRSVVGIGAGPEGGVEVQSLWSGRRYPLASGAMRAAAFMDADRVAAVGEQGEVFRWSLSQQRMQVLADHEIAGGSAWGLAVSAQEDLVATSTSSRRDQVVRISSLIGGPQQSWPLPQGQIHALSFAGSSVVAGTTWGRLQVKDLATGRSTSTALGTYRWLWTAAPLPGGGYLVGTGHSLGADQRRGNARLLHVQGDEVHEIFAARPGGNTGISDIQLTPDGRRAVAASSAGDLVLFDLPHGKATVLDHVAGAAAGDPVFALVEGGEAVVTGGGDSTLRVWDATTGELRSELRLGAGRIYDLAVQGETARVLVATSDGHLGLWNLATGRQERSYRGHTTAILRARFDREHRLVVSSDLSGRVCVRSVDSEVCSTWLEGHRPGESIFRVQFLRDRRLLTFSNDGAARLWRPLVTSDAAELARELEQ
ncbi:MAG TPA: hypothetical protein PKU97_23085, partial [Kofleriaceae bacterium]|nr:hypothetical protein [Kofleriaceae bacterium]